MDNKKTDRLTPRQKQIMLLLLEGKENKEIAHVLTISLGTVKQHINSLLKKLEVKNRTSAVSLALKEMGEVNDDQIYTDASVLCEYSNSYRPVIFFSMQVSQQLDAVAYQKISHLIGYYSFQCKANVINLRNRVCYIVFGMERTSCDDLILAYKLSEDFNKIPGAYNKYFKIAIYSDFANISQKKFGGWSAQYFKLNASLAIEKKMAQLSFGQVHICEKTIEIAEAFNLPWIISLDKKNKNQSMLAPYFYMGDTLDLSINENEVNQIKNELSSDRNTPFLLIGESGMGKTKIIMEIAKELDSGCFEYLKVTTDGCLIDFNGSAIFWCLSDFKNDLLSRGKDTTGGVFFFDDYHNIKREDEQELFDLVCFLQSLSFKVVLSGRKGRHPQLLTKGWKVAVIGKPKEQDVYRIIKQHCDKLTANERALVELSRSVPFFLRELLSHKKLSLAVVSMIAERIDYFNMDWDILYTVALENNQMTVSDLSKKLNGYSVGSIDLEVAHARECGVFSSENEYVSFKHPLVRASVKSLSTGNLSLS